MLSDPALPVSVLIGNSHSQMDLSSGSCSLDIGEFFRISYHKLRKSNWMLPIGKGDYRYLIKRVALGEERVEDPVTVELRNVKFRNVSVPLPPCIPLY